MTTRTKLSLAAAVILVTGFFVLFVGGGSRHAIGLVLRPMAETFGWGRSTLGTAVALFLFVSASCMFITGHLADRFPLRAILGGGLLISAVGIGLMSVATEPWHIYLLYGVIFAIGNGVASITPVGVMITRRFPERAGFANAFAISGMGLGQLLIISALAAVLVTIGWQSVFVWLGAINLVLFPLVMWAVSQGERKKTGSPEPAVEQQGLSTREALKTRSLWLLLSVYAVCGFQDFFVSTHIVAFAQDTGVATLFAGNLLAFMGLAGLLGVIAAGVWSDRFGPIGATIACFIVRIAIFTLVLINKDIISVTAFAMLFGMTYWITAPLTVVFVRNAFGTKSLGALSGLVTMVHHMCGGIGAYFGAAVFDAQGSYDTSFILMLGCSMLAIVLTSGLARTPEPIRARS